MRSLFLIALSVALVSCAGSPELSAPGDNAAPPEKTPASPRTVTLAWNAPTLDTKGKRLKVPITGYRVAYGLTGGAKTHKKVVSGTTTQLNLPPGSYAFVVYARTSTGESAPSNEVTKRIL